MRHERIGGNNPDEAFIMVSIPETPEEIEREAQKELVRKQAREAAETKRLAEVRAEAERLKNDPVNVALLAAVQSKDSESFVAALPAIADLGTRISSLQLRMIGDRLLDTEKYDGRMSLEQGMALRELVRRYKKIKMGDAIVPDTVIPIPPSHMGPTVVPAKPTLKDRFFKFFS